MSREIALTLRMLSDWHIGSGTGRYGRLSRQVMRDEHGLPFVPAKSLNGVWRDGCEIAARALDEGGTGIWHDWVDHLFGHQPAFPGAEAGETPEKAARHPRPAALRYRGPLRFPGGLGSAIAGNRRLREAVTFVKPGVAHDPVSGAAKEDMLRFDEMARGGVTLTGTAELPDGMSQEQLGCAHALLWAGARLVEGIGGKRRRGAGRCRLDLGGAGLPPGAGELAHRTANPVAPPQAGPRPGPDVTEVPGMGDGWERVLLELTLETPLLAHDRTVGNLVQGRDHAPGWMLLGPLLARLDAPTAAAAARCGGLVVTPATPMVGGLPGRPVPRVIERAKDGTNAHLNRMTEGPVEGGAYKRVRRGYVGGAPVTAIESPGFVLRMHNTIEDTTQRPTQALGGVYVYRALAPGTVLAAEVRIRRGILDEGWWRRLDGRWRLGRSSKDDYGLVTVAATPMETAEQRPAAVGSGERLRVWLQSDTLVRDERLAPSDDPDDLARLLERAFAAAGAAGVRLAPVLHESGLVPTSYEIARTDSWHRGWRLPRPVLVGFAAGGCVTFEVTRGRISADVLASVELSGIGERRGEGFGQIRVNDTVLTRRPSGAVRGTPAEPGEPAPGSGQAPEALPALPPGDPGHAGARLIERAAWRAEIWRLAEERTARPDAVLGHLIELPATRMNALRRLFDHLDEEPDRLDERVTALTARWNEPEATSAIRALLVGGDAWTLLGLSDQDGLCLTTDGPDVLRRSLRGEALRSLLTACLAAHTRREARPGEERR